MTATISLTESQVLAALRAFITAALPACVEVVKGQDNRVSEPEGRNFVTMTPILRERLETNVVTTSDGFFNTPPTPGTRSDMQPTRITVQLDVHGPAAGDNAQIITTLFRSEVGTAAFSATGYDVMPLYTSEPRQLPFSNGEQQIEERWSIDVVMQCNPIVTTPQDFAGALSVTPINVGAAYSS